MRKWLIGLSVVFIVGILVVLSFLLFPLMTTESKIDRIWGSLSKTRGQEDVIRSKLDVLALPETEEHARLIDETKRFLIENVPHYLGSRSLLEQEAATAGGIKRERIDEILAEVEIIRKAAEIYFIRGTNYYNLKQYDQALEEYYQALTIYPAYSAIYRAIAQLYDIRKQPEKCLSYLQIALEVNPKNYIVLYDLGTFYFWQRKYDDAINYYTQALGYNPKDALFNYAIGKSYQCKGHVGRAADYFQKYIEYDPNGSFAPSIKQYFAVNHIAIEEKPMNPATLLREKQYETLEKFLDGLLKKKEKNKEGYGLLAEAYDTLGTPPGIEKNYETWLTCFADWIKENPSSHFAQAGLGAFYLKYAWEARGSGWAVTITEQANMLFGERLLKARESFEKAYRLNESDPVVPAMQIKVAMGLGLDSEEVEKQFERAIRADATDISAYSSKLTYLMPKWHGSEEQMFQFARKTAAEAPRNSIACLILANAHWEMNARTEDKEYFKNPGVWKEVKAVYNQILEYYPQANGIQNWLALAAYLAGDYETAKQGFIRIGYDWTPECWGNLKYFEEVKTEVLKN
jgi:tetratricopeptide (TPR) repeat protein